MALQRPSFTHDDLAQMPDGGKRYELCEGELIVSPAPVTKHQRVQAVLGNSLLRAEEAGLGQVFNAPTEVAFSRNNVVQPDLLFVRSERLHIITRPSIQGPPDPVVEILSPSTPENDLGRTMTLYARHGVPHYWVVDVDASLLPPYTLGDTGYIEGCRCARATRSARHSSPAPRCRSNGSSASSQR